MLSVLRNLSSPNPERDHIVKLNGRTVELIINALAFQVIWAVAVLLGDGWAVLASLVYLIVHQLLLVNNVLEWALVLGVTLVGCSMDTLFGKIGVLEFDSGTILLPVWLACIWLGFAMTLKHAMAWLRDKLFIAALVGAVAGPVAYYTGAQMSEVTLAQPMWLSLFSLAIWWACFMPFAMRCSRVIDERA